MPFVKISSLDQLWKGEMQSIVVQGTRLLLVNVDGHVTAFQDRCAHQAALLSRGYLEDRTLTCSAHGWTYDALTGCGINPRNARLRAYPVRVEGEEIYVDLETESVP